MKPGLDTGAPDQVRQIGGGHEPWKWGPAVPPIHANQWHSRFSQQRSGESAIEQQYERTGNGGSREQGSERQQRNRLINCVRQRDPKSDAPYRVEQRQNLRGAAYSSQFPQQGDCERDKEQLRQTEIVHSQ